MIKRIGNLLLAAVLLGLFGTSGQAQLASRIYENGILAHNGTSWVKLTKGWLYAPAPNTLAVKGAITSGQTGTNGGITVKSTGAGATTFSVAGATGNTVVSGTLGVTGASTLTGATQQTGNLTVGKNGASGAVAGLITLNDGGNPGTSTTLAASTYSNAVFTGTLRVTAGIIAAMMVRPFTADTSLSLSNAPSGCLVTTTGAGGAVNFTLETPAAGNAGVNYTIINTVDQNMVITCTGHIGTKGAANKNTVTFSTGGEKIGATVRVICDGTTWWVYNMSLNTAVVAP
jgi:hypothetical protein